ncbi:hypothetical protein ABMA57_00990 [Saccharospirillum sp. HFRX-1]|uniref:hypothetical protein n=1 Tax=unclassified Saccharospirillum TaxID=2633430 RepID=UPI00372028DE
MTHLDVIGATDVYENISKCKIIRHRVNHAALADFSFLLRNFINSLGDEIADEFWRQTLGPIRQLGFALCSTPLPFRIASKALRIDWSEIYKKRALCKQKYPDMYEEFEVVIKQLDSLSIDYKSPFLEPLEKISYESKQFGLTHSNSRINGEVINYLNETEAFKNAIVASTSQLRNKFLYSTLVVIGPCGWFPEHIFLAPCADFIHVIVPSWIKDSWEPAPLFLHGSDSASGNIRSHNVGKMPVVISGSDIVEKPHNSLLPEDVIPPFPPCRGITQFFKENLGDDDEVVPACLCYLNGWRAVFIATDSGHSSLVIDTSEIEKPIIKHVPASELKSGDYIVLRTSGGGDYVAMLADRIMGEMYSIRRSEQSEWKKKIVSNAIEKYGVESRWELSKYISVDLESQGSAQVRPANIHYWLSSKCIRPRKFEDFFAVLSFAGIEERALELWSAMGDIDNAHRRAGYIIRRMLLNKIKTTSLESLERDGEMHFKLKDEDGGSISAFHITDIVTDNYKVSYDQIGVLMEIGY